MFLVFLDKVCFFLWLVRLLFFLFSLLTTNRCFGGLGTRFLLFVRPFGVGLFPGLGGLCLGLCFGLGLGQGLMGLAGLGLVIWT